MNLVEIDCTTENLTWATPWLDMLAWLKKILPKCSRSGNTSAWRGRLAPPESTEQ